MRKVCKLDKNAVVLWTAVMRILQISNVLTNVDILCRNSLQINKDPFKNGASCFLFFLQFSRWQSQYLYPYSRILFIHFGVRGPLQRSFRLLFITIFMTRERTFISYPFFLLQKLLNNLRDSFSYFYYICWSLWGLYSSNRLSSKYAASISAVSLWFLFNGCSFYST